MIVKSFDGNEFGTDYTAVILGGGGITLPGGDVQSVERTGAWPLSGGRRRGGRALGLGIAIEGSDVKALRTQLFQWFDPEDETSKKLAITDDDGENERYIHVELDGDMAVRDEMPMMYTVPLKVDGDVRWRAETETSDEWNITASGQTHEVSNGGTDDAWPSFEVTPTTVKSGGYAYREFWAVKWRSDNPAFSRPLRLGPIDTATLVGASKMQADGDDLRVMVDGQEVDRWLVDMNTANTYVWINVDFAPQRSATLQTNIPDSGAISSIEVGEEIYDFQDGVMLQIDDELFYATARDLAEEDFTGITRAMFNTSEAAHTAGATVYWIQREIKIPYGNVSVSAPDVDDDYKPAFSLAAADSDNEEWKYTEFGDSNEKRTGQWLRWGRITLAERGGCYTATQRTLGSPYSVMGAWSSALRSGYGYGWCLVDPCGIVNAAWADGYKRAETKEDFWVRLRYLGRGEFGWTNQVQLALPSEDNTWEAWSEAKAGSDWDAARGVSLYMFSYPQDVEVGTVTVYLNTAETPVVMACGEEGNYPLSATLTNTTTGESIDIEFDMDLGETLTINAGEGTVTYDQDGSFQRQAVEPDSVRTRYLTLAPGPNTLRLDDTGTAAVTVVTKFRKRTYQ